ncbi:MAG: DUF3516 domain-containing protein [Acidimicrobiales bacterium]|nr:DUF3516 domain-containing protein [Acidimicrobiales bacterium]
MLEPTTSDPDELLDHFLDYTGSKGLELYPAQEEAILELLAGSNVILATPTGSGKSLVAEAAHYAALATGRRSFYTAPIKALVSEKFFALCQAFGTENVGMITGDAAVNAGAPIIACTAEIVANMALREGAEGSLDMVIMDEFHFYADPQRGWAWQVPLLELPHAQFLLLSATLGPTRFFEEDLTERTGRSTVTVAGAERPVPLEFEYRHTPLHQSVQELLDLDRAPVYLVHFTQRAATEAAQALTSLNVLTKDEKAAVNAAVGGFRFDSPVGKDLRRWIGHGIGVHHAGLLPKYRLLVEKLAQQGLLKVICGTDTLGVGVNVPIRTVAFTQLCKYDGISTRVLQNREFQQIAGRAGRRGFDDKGYVWAQAPAHSIENRVAEEKAATDPKKRKKLVKKKPPERGYAHWDENTFTKMIEGQPEPLQSSFTVTHQMMMELLDRPGDGCAQVRRLLTSNHEPRKRQRHHIRRSIQIYRSLLAADVLELLPEPDHRDRLVRVTIDLQADFALHQPLSLFAVEAVASVVEGEHDPLDVVSVVESVLENPGVILAAQLDKLKGELITQWKAEGVEYDERMARLDDVTYPKPLAEQLYAMFDTFRLHHPWVGTENVKPKSVVRDMFERAMTFREFVNHYGLKRSEGAVLRYLSDAYKALVQNVPEEAKTDDVYDFTEWLGELIRQIDSSLLDEWERIRNPDEPATEVRPGATDGSDPDARPDVTANKRAFRVMIRNQVFRWVSLLARRDYATVADLLADEHGRTTWSATDLAEQLADYWAEHVAIVLDGDARSSRCFVLDESDPVSWTVRQTLVDPDEHGEWALEARVDLAASRDRGEPALTLTTIRRL